MNSDANEYIAVVNQWKKPILIKLLTIIRTIEVHFMIPFLPPGNYTIVVQAS